MRRLVGLAIAAIAVASMLPAEACQPATVVSTSTNHDGATISIANDEQFKTNPAVTGGTGSAEDPYRIENRDISVRYTIGIMISHTTAHFLIRNVTVRDVRTPGERNYYGCCFAGISIQGARNGRIEDVRIEKAQIGLGLSSPTNLLVRGAVIVDAPQGIAISGATNLTLSGNSLVNSSFAVTAFPPENASSLHIGEDNTINGLPIYFRSGCSSGAEADRDFGAVFLFNCHDFAIRHSRLPTGVGAIEVRNSHDILFEEVKAPSFTAQAVDALSILGAEAEFITLDDFTNVTVQGSTTPASSFTHVVARNGTGFLVDGNALRGDSILAIGAPVDHWCSCMGPAPPMGVARTVITNNTLSDGRDSAITLYDAPFAVVEDNRILNHTDGIEAGAQPGVSVQRNHLEGSNASQGTAIEASGEGVRIRGNSIAFVQTGLNIGPAVEATNNQLNATDAGMRLHMGGSPLSRDNAMQTGGVYATPDPQDPFGLGPNNTVNGLPIFVHIDCDGVHYGGGAVGQLIFIACANVTVANLSFADIAHPITLIDVADFAIENISTDRARIPIYLTNCWSGRVSNSTLNSDSGVMANEVLNVSFVGNRMDAGEGSLQIRWSDMVEVVGNHFAGGAYGSVSLQNAWEVTVRGNDLGTGGLQMSGDQLGEFASHQIDDTNTVAGLPLVYLADLAGPMALDSTVGELIIANCRETLVRNVEVVGAEPGLVLAFDQGVILDNVTVTANWSALSAWAVDDLTILGGTYGADYPGPPLYGTMGISFLAGGNLTLRGANVSAPAGYALHVEFGSKVFIDGSRVSGGYFGVYVGGAESLEIANSTIDGLYAAYLRKIADLTVRDSRFVGQEGLMAGDVERGTIERNQFLNLSLSGITIEDLQNMSIRNNEISGSGVAITMGDGSNNLTIEENTLRANEVGIFFSARASSPGQLGGPVWVMNNTIEGNGVGLRGNASSAVTVYHNRFLNNTLQASVTPGGLYDAGYLIGGNYWSDYRGKDECSGYAQETCTGPDLYGDTPYCLGAMGVSAESVDHYPLMLPTAPPARNPPPPPPQTLAPTPAGFSITWLLAVMAVAAAGAAALALIQLRRRARTDADTAEAEIAAQANGPDH